MELLKKIINNFKSKNISYEDLSFLNELLNTNLPIKTCFNLIENKRNKYILDKIIEKLDKGLLIEEIILDYLPKDINNYMANLIKRLSFKDSLELALSFVNKNKTNLKTFEKALSYPVLILFASLTALYIFDLYGLDVILNLMKTFNNDISFIISFRIILRIIIYLFYFGFIVISIFLLLFLKPKRITLFYIFVCRYLPNSIIKTYFTEDFISLFTITLNFGYKTKDALEILKGLKNKPIISFLAFHIDEKLLTGASLKEAALQNYYDDSLVKFISIASYTTNFIGILNNYAYLASEKIKSRMRKYTMSIQFFSYLIVGVVIIFIYQVLFLPMQAISVF